jgi:O-antigen ligase
VARAAVAGRGVGPSRPWSALELPWPAFFGGVLALYAAVIVSRLHEVVPFISHLYPGKLLAVLLLGAAMAQMKPDQFNHGFKTTVGKCVLVITVLSLASVPGSAWPRQSVSFFQNQWSQTLLMFACIMAGFTNRRIAYLTILFVTFTAALGALEFFAGGGQEFGGRAYIGSDSSSTYDANASAALFVTVLPYLVMLATKKGKLQVAAMIAIPITIAAVVKTVSRGGIIALAVCAITLLVVAPKKQRKFYIGLLVVMVATVLISPHQSLSDRFSLLGDSQDYNFNARDGRIEVWKRGLQMMLTHPFLGVGVRAYEVANGTTAHSWVNAHNAIVQIGAELGIGGFIVFIAMFAAAFKAARMVRRRYAPTGGVFASPEAEFEYSLATAALVSLVTELAAAMFLSMAYDAMTIFVVAVPAVLAMGVRSPAPVRRGAASQPPPRAPRRPSVQVGTAGWRTGRRIPPSLPVPRPNAP